MQPIPTLASRGPNCASPEGLAWGAVHLWSLCLGAAPERLDRHLGLLALEERRRADSFRTALARRRFIAGRLALRQVLSRYLDCDPAGFSFATEPGGKPRLGGAHRESALEFNLSHSGERALLAVARGRAVGVDLEQVRSTVDYEAIAEGFLSPKERAALGRLPRSDRVAAFFACWTRKEALLKGMGTGLALAPASLSVTLGPGPGRLLGAPGLQTLRRRFQFVEVRAGSGWAAALVVGRVGPSAFHTCK